VNSVHIIHLKQIVDNPAFLGKLILTKAFLRFALLGKYQKLKTANSTLH